MPALLLLKNQDDGQLEWVPKNKLTVPGWSQVLVGDWEPDPRSESSYYYYVLHDEVSDSGSDSDDSEATATWVEGDSEGPFCGADSPVLAVANRSAQEQRWSVIEVDGSHSVAYAPADRERLLRAWAEFRSSSRRYREARRRQEQEQEQRAKQTRGEAEVRRRKVRWAFA
jgi:hypothetical protein